MVHSLSLLFGIQIPRGATEPRSISHLTTPHSLRPHPPALFFPPWRKRNIRLASTMGSLAQAADGVARLLQARKLRSDVSQRSPARRHTLTHKTRLVKVIFKKASTSLDARLPFVSFYHFLPFLISLPTVTHSRCARTHTRRHAQTHRHTHRKSFCTLLRFIYFNLSFIHLYILSSHALQHLIGHMAGHVNVTGLMSTAQQNVSKTKELKGNKNTLQKEFDTHKYLMTDLPLHSI